MGEHIVIDGDLTLEFWMDGAVSLDLHEDGEPSNVIKVVERDAPVYTGATEVDPDFVGSTLETAHKIVLEDIKVNPIQVESVSNPSGGRTVYIGGVV